MLLTARAEFVAALATVYKGPRQYISTDWNRALWKILHSSSCFSVNSRTFRQHLWCAQENELHEKVRRRQSGEVFWRGFAELWQLIKSVLDSRVIPATWEWYQEAGRVELVWGKKQNSDICVHSACACVNTNVQVNSACVQGALHQTSWVSVKRFKV